MAAGRIVVTPAGVTAVAAAVVLPLKLVSSVHRVRNDRTYLKIMTTFTTTTTARTRAHTVSGSRQKGFLGVKFTPQTHT